MTGTARRPTLGRLSAVSLVQNIQTIVRSAANGRCFRQQVKTQGAPEQPSLVSNFLAVVGSTSFPYVVAVSRPSISWATMGEQPPVSIAARTEQFAKPGCWQA